MRFLPVLDLQAGLVVRGIAGRRHEYRPIQSNLCPGADPLNLARAFRLQFGLADLYLADLDAIAGQPPALTTLQSLLADGFRVHLDAGVRTTAQAQALAWPGITVVVGLETVVSLGVLADLAPGLTFSLDLRGGEPLTSATWDGPREPEAIAQAVFEQGCRSLLLLDLARVGTASGTGTLDLCRRLRARYPDLELLAGGGVRGCADLEALAGAGVSTVLLASALHDGKLRRADLARFQRASRGGGQERQT